MRGPDQVPAPAADREYVGYEQAIARRAELQGSNAAAYAPAAGRAAGQAGGVSNGQAALFQQQLTAATMDSMAAADAGMPPTTTGAAADPYAALQSGGLSTQAGIMAQMQGMVAQNQGGAAATMSNGFTVDQLQAMLAQAQGQTSPVASSVAGSAPTNVTGKIDKLDPELLGRLDRLGAQLGVKIDVISGNRTTEEQAALYQKYLNGTGNLAAPPGKSNHEHGAAADVYVNGVALANVPGARDAAAKLGLHFPVGGEAWHVERSDH